MYNFFLFEVKGEKEERQAMDFTLLALLIFLVRELVAHVLPSLLTNFLLVGASMVKWTKKVVHNMLK